MQGSLSEAAHKMLLEAWDDCPKDPEHKGSNGCGWKGRGGLLAELLQMYIRHSEDPVSLLAQLVRDAVMTVPAAATGKEMHEPVEAFSIDLATGLSSATLSTWFKTLMAELMHQWQELASLTATLSKAHRLSSSSAHTVSDDKVEHLLRQMQVTTGSFTALLDVVKIHERRKLAFTRILPFVSWWIKLHQDTFDHLYNTLCAEGKARKDVQVSKLIECPDADEESEAQSGDEAGGKTTSRDQSQGCED
eukprot:jgi/Astpho2/1596/Aster-x0071